jgi:hypothetical protein
MLAGLPWIFGPRRDDLYGAIATTALPVAAMMGAAFARSALDADTWRSRAGMAAVAAVAGVALGSLVVATQLYGGPDDPISRIGSSVPLAVMGLVYFGLPMLVVAFALAATAFAVLRRIAAGLRVAPGGDHASPESPSDGRLT